MQFVKIIIWCIILILNNNCGIFYAMVKSMAISDNLKRGTVELSVLILLQKSDMYGYEISQQLFEQSGELYQIQEIVSDSLSFG